MYNSYKYVNIVSTYIYKRNPCSLTNSSTSYKSIMMKFCKIIPYRLFMKIIPFYKVHSPPKVKSISLRSVKNHS